MRMETCFGCGKEFFELCTLMRCNDCVKNKVQIQTSPVSDAYWTFVDEQEKIITADGSVFPTNKEKEE